MTATATLPAPVLNMAEGFKPRRFPMCKTCGSVTEHTAAATCRTADSFTAPRFAPAEVGFLGTRWDVEGVLYEVVSLAPKTGHGSDTEAFWAYSATGDALRLIISTERRVLLAHYSPPSSTAARAA